MLIAYTTLDIEKLATFALEHNKSALHSFDATLGHKSLRDCAILFKELFYGANILDHIFVSAIVKYLDNSDLSHLAAYVQITPTTKGYILGTGSIMAWLTYCVETPNEKQGLQLFNCFKQIAPMIQDYVIINQGTLQWKHPSN